MAEEIKELPGCVALFDVEDVTCNGDSSEPPCAWRDMCGAFKQFLEDHEEDREEYLDIHENADGSNYAMAAATNNTDFVEFCNDQVEEYGVDAGVPTKEPEPVEETVVEPEPVEETVVEPEEGDGTGDIEGTGEDVDNEEATEEPSEATIEPKKGKKPKAKKIRIVSEMVKERQAELLVLFEHFMCELYAHFPAERRTTAQQPP